MNINSGKIRKELMLLLGVVVVMLVILKIVFYKEPLPNILKFGVSLAYFSLLPGYAIILNLSEHFSTIERIIISFPIGLAVYSILGYYVNIFIHLRFLLFIPLVLILVSGAIYHYKSNKKPQSTIL